MSANWYWDWNWSGAGGKGGGRTPHVHQKDADPVPEGIGSERGPCKKHAVYKGTEGTDPDPGDPPQDKYPNWRKFTLMETDHDGNALAVPPSPPAEWYWVK